MRLWFAGLVCLVLAPAAEVSAQSRPAAETPKADIALGLGGTIAPWLGSTDEAGFFATGGRNLTSRFGVAGELGVYFRREVVRVDSRTSRAETFRAGTTVAFGPRFATRFMADTDPTPPPIDHRFFAQVLGGAEIDRNGKAHRLVQPGAGVDLTTPAGVMVRIQGDYRVVRTNRELSGPRLGLWLVVPVGGRHR